MDIIGTPGVATAIPPSGRVTLPRPLVLTIPDPELDRAPTSINVWVIGAPAGSTVTLSIDGSLAWTGEAISSGPLGPISLPVGLDPSFVEPTFYAAGTHVIEASCFGVPDASGEFTLLTAPPLTSYLIGADVEPAAVPEAIVGDVSRWVFQDPAPSGLGSFVLPHNPISMAPLPFTKQNLQAAHTTAPDGQWHVTDAIPQPIPWSFQGRLFTQDFHDQLLAFAALNRRWYLIDHRNRAWTVTIVGCSLEAQKRKANNAEADWEHTYAVNALIYSTNWKVPA